jgi:C1A family cysteine protease
MTFGLGYLPDLDTDVAADLRHKHVGALIGAAPIGVPVSLDLSWALDAVQNQGSTSSCVGQALASSIYMRGKIAGHTIARPSACAIYTFARLVNYPHTVLADTGSRPRMAMIGLQDFGVVAESRWPLSPATLNEPLPLDVFQHGAQALLTDYYRIDSAPGSGASTLIKAALARGFIPTFAIDVDESYQQYKGGVWRGRTGPSLGGHYQAIVGYDADSMLVLNSWGTGWGLDGFARIEHGFFDLGFARDILVPTVTPTAVT